ncbi:MAG TPA: substrate-binding domain-containing protein [Anaerolineales bacterium]|nr:substrate-binding domain-containing protein [Anaerolineales bacterium]
MNKVEPLHAFEQIKLLSDSRRLQILRLLMAAPASLTQLAKTLNQSPAWVRHHIVALESANLIELSEVRITGKVTEKFYRARAGAFLLQELILPEGGKPTIVFSGSHDLALETVSAQIADHLTLLTLPVGSLDGLVNLRQGLCQISGAHLLDKSGEYNTPFVRHLFPDRMMDLITLAYRTQGLMLAPGNPKGVRGVSDLARAGLRFINRNPGSGTRLWLDQELARLGILPEAVDGYEQVVNTHTECARAIASGGADAALGLQASAQQFKLDFIPLFEERYDLVLPREQEHALAPLLEHIQTAAFRRDLNALTGYNTSHSGEQIDLD